MQVPASSSETARQPDMSGSGGRVYKCGTLTYTRAGLITLFAWLLWGDVVFTIMETVGPSVLPLKLKALGASNTTMALIMSVLPSIFNMTVCPWISFVSDRHRGPLGRRIPFILWTAPFLTLCLVLAGWSPELSSVLQGKFSILKDVAPATITIALIGVFYACFVFFNMFVNSVFWYLFNDVVPPQFLGRFMGFFKIMGTGAAALYNGFIFPHAETHMRWILTGGALVYLVGFGLMCLRVKEGQYPPPPVTEKKHPGFLGDLKLYFQESFSCKFYWYFYLASGFGAFAGGMGLFYVFFNQEMGLSLDQIGKLNMYGAFAALAATYFAAIFVDRWHPLRILTYTAIFGSLTGFGSWIWIFISLPADQFFWLSLGGLLVTTFGVVLQQTCGIPVFMRLMPKSLYGQISGANAIVGSLGWITGGALAGLCMDLIKNLCGGTDFAYRWIFIWAWVFGIAATVFRVQGYREWNRLGGDVSYRPPAPWDPSGFEEVADKVKSRPTKPRLVMVSLYTTLVGGIVNILLVLVFMWQMRVHGMMNVFVWHAAAFIPIKLILTSMSYWQLVHIRRDMDAVANGKEPQLGIPHHGVLLVNAIQGLIYFPVYWLQTVWMIHSGMQYELILFGINTLLLTLAGVAGIEIVRWVERGSPRGER